MRVRLLASTLGAAFVGWCGALALAAVPTEASGEARVRGELLFRAHCAVCHGVEGRGNGPEAADLRKPPADLTRLRPDGEALPVDALRAVIDGRRGTSGHGSREMPIWGLTFRQLDRDDDQEAAVAGAIDDLLAYLVSIQEPTP